MKLRPALRFLKRLNPKNRRFLVFLFLVWAFWFLGLGTLIGWITTKSNLSKLPPVTSNDRILILAPHIDDEVISSAGLIQEALAAKASITIVYFTNGDENLPSVVISDRSFKVAPTDLVTLGLERMTEGRNATKLLGLSEDSLIFLGYPDGGLYSMLSTNFLDINPYTSKATKFNFNPYQGTFRSQQPYSGNQVIADLTSVIQSFQPNIVIIPHPKDKNSDHRAVYLFWEKVKTETNYQGLTYAYLVHYPQYPPENVPALQASNYLYPPKRLFTPNNWFTLILTDQEMVLKNEAIRKNVTQLNLGKIHDLLFRFGKRNEIFEEID